VPNDVVKDFVLIGSAYAEFSKRIRDVIRTITRVAAKIGLTLKRFGM
jgi:hypothetical protein